MNKNRFFYLLAVTILLSICGNVIIAEPAVTYNITGGRFGDQVLVYMRAKWLCYKYNMTMLCKAFAYSDKLALNDYEKKIDVEGKKYQKRIAFNPGTKIDPDYTKSIVYIVNPIKCETPDHLNVDWSDEGFITVLKKMVAPKKPIQKMKFPEGYVTVAVHVRKGEYEKQLRHKFALKFIDEQFYIDQILWLYEKCNKVPLYIFIFTDEEKPELIKNRFEQQLAGLKVIIDCRKDSIGRNKNVLEDYFSFLQFDCFIHGLSNFSTTASRIGDFYIDIYPVQDGRTIKPNEKVVVEKPQFMPLALINHCVV